MSIQDCLVWIALAAAVNGQLSITGAGSNTVDSTTYVIFCQISSFTSLGQWDRDGTVGVAQCTSTICIIQPPSQFIAGTNSSGIYIRFNPLKASEKGIVWTCKHGSDSFSFNIDVETRLGSSIDLTRTLYTEAVMNSENVLRTDISSDVLKIATFEIAYTFKTSLSFTSSDYFAFSSRFNSSDQISYSVFTQFLGPGLSGLSGVLFTNTLIERHLTTTLYSTVDLVLTAFASELITAESTAHVSNLETDFSLIYSTLEMKPVTLESIWYVTHSSSAVSSEVSISITTCTKQISTVTKELESSFTHVPAFDITQSIIASEVTISNTRNSQSDIVPSSRQLESSILKHDMLLTLINNAPSTLFYGNSFYRVLGLVNDTFTSEFGSIYHQISSVSTSPETILSISVSTSRESLQTHFDIFFTSSPFAVLSTIYRQAITQKTEQAAFSSVTASSVSSKIEPPGIWNLQLTVSCTSLFFQSSYTLSNTFRTSSADFDTFNDTFTSESLSHKLSTVGSSSERNIISVSTNRESLQTHLEISFTSNVFSVSRTRYPQTITRNTEETSFSSMTESSIFSVTESSEILNLQLSSSGSSLFLQPSYTLSNAFRSPSALYSVDDKSRLSLVFSTTETQHVTLSSQVLLSTTTPHKTGSASGLSMENIIIISSSVAGGLVTILFIILITIYMYKKFARIQSNKNISDDDDDKHDNISDPSTVRGSDYPYMSAGIPLRLNYISHIPYSYDYYCDYEHNWKNA